MPCYNLVNPKGETKKLLKASKAKEGVRHAGYYDIYCFIIWLSISLKLSDNILTSDYCSVILTI